MLLQAVIFTALSILPQNIAATTDAAGLSTQVAYAAKDEMSIIDRLQNLRAATQNLPKEWKVRNRKTKQVVTKQVLLYQLETMELMAAERWNQLVRSMALIANLNETKESKIRSNLEKLTKLQVAMNARLDTYNQKLKAGILVNLAAKIENSSTTAPKEKN